MEKANLTVPNLALKEVFMQTVKGVKELPSGFHPHSGFIWKTMWSSGETEQKLGASSFRCSAGKASRQVTITETLGKSLDLPSPSQTHDDKMKWTRVKFPFPESKASFKGVKAA